MGKLRDRVAIVTGAASGIGRATAVAFGGEGATVVVSDTNAALAEKVVGEVTRAGGEATFVPCDVASGEQVQQLVVQTLKTFGRLDIAFNNAGIAGEQAPVAELSEEGWQRTLAVNLTGVFLCMKYELAAMEKGGGGAIVNNASILGTVGYPNAAAYVSSKHAILGLTKTAAIDYAKKNIRVNAVCPGFIETPMLERSGVLATAEMLTALQELHPLGRLGTPDEVAQATLWLCSDAASFVTGHPLLVDGGYVAR